MLTMRYRITYRRPIVAKYAVQSGFIRTLIVGHPFMRTMRYRATYHRAMPDQAKLYCTIRFHINGIHRVSTRANDSTWYNVSSCYARSCKTILSNPIRINANRSVSNGVNDATCAMYHRAMPDHAKLCCAIRFRINANRMGLNNKSI
jgi:hypothetical protein